PYRRGQRSHLRGLNRGHWLPARSPNETGPQRCGRIHYALRCHRNSDGDRRRRGRCYHSLLSPYMTEPTQNGQPVIAVKGLKMGYGDKVLMEKLDFEVHRGEVFIILGGSGCGKSSLLKHMIGLYKPMAGEVWFGPDNLVTATGDDRIRILRKFG